MWKGGYIFLFQLLKPRLWSQKNYFSTPPIQSFPIPTPQNIIIQLQLQHMYSKKGVQLHPKICDSSNSDLTI